MKTHLPRPRRTTGRLIGLGALLACLSLLSACGFNPQTDAVYQPAAGTNNRSGTVYILNSVIVTDKQGEGTWAGSLVNTNQSKPEQLVNVTYWNAAGAPITIKPADLVNFGQTGQIMVHSPKIKSGAFVPMTFSFASGQITHLLTPVLPYDPSEKFSAVPLPSQSPTAKPGKRSKKCAKQKPTDSQSGTSFCVTSSPSPTSTPSE